MTEDLIKQVQEAGMHYECRGFKVYAISYLEAKKIIEIVREHDGGENEKAS